MSTSYMTTMTGSSYTMAKRNGGVCQGSLWRTVDANTGSSEGTASSALISSSSSSFALLVGVQLICYESVASRKMGHHPIATYSVVGASAMSNDPTAFRVVTDQGSHLLCSTPTRSCRDVWLSALYAGLECRLQPFNNTNNNNNNLPPHRHSDPSQRLMSRVRPKLRGSVLQRSQRYCHSCGKLERLEFPLSPNPAPLPQYGIEERVELCYKCDLAQGMVDHCHWLEELYQTQQQEQNAMLEARNLILSKLEEEEVNVAAYKSSENGENDASTQQPPPSNSQQPDRDESGRLLPKSHTLQLQPLSHNLVSEVLNSPKGLSLQRLSPTLKSLCSQFQQGMIGVLEFMELLEHAMGIRDPAMAELKKQAFRVAGDMGTALKLLYEQCLPPDPSLGSGEDGLIESKSSHHLKDESTDPNANSIELLQCILEFFLDLVEEGELPTLAFFWPQISNIHLQMLPPQDTTSLQKIELLEDFLLTVASKYSIHLAIELVWSHVADLEDALSGNHNTTATCGLRKSAVLRFLCELESLLFDFDTGWGGGSVTLGQFLSPSNHQIDLLKASMERIQSYRLAAEHDRLSRSHRLHKLQSHVEQTVASPESLAQEALRIAKNADYLSSHLAFTKRLCDTAEKLRFLPIEDRNSALEEALAKLNASGTMGGDPLNRIKRSVQDHIRVVRIPTTEGHVFRSKERTPVLLLVETLDEAAEESLSSEDLKEYKEGPDCSPPDEVTTEDGATLQPQNADVSKEEEKKEVNCSESDQDVETTEVTDSLGDVKTENEDETSEHTPKFQIQTEKESDQTPRTPICPKPEEGAYVNETTALDENAPSHSLQNKMGSMHSYQSEASTSMAGSQDGIHDDVNSTRHALRRFDSPRAEPKIVTPTTSKAVVETLVTNVVAKQLDLPNLMQGDIEEGDEEAEEEDSDERDVRRTKDGERPNESKTEEVHISYQFSPTKKTELSKPSKMSTLTKTGSQKPDRGKKLSKTGDTRREVLNAIMMKGMSGSHVIAEQAASGAQRHLQDLERRVAVEALLTGDSDVGKESGKHSDQDEKRQELLSLGIRSASSDDLDTVNPITDDDETMEAIRLILIQYRVANGSISANDAAAALAPRPRTNSKSNGKSTMMHFGKEFPEIDAGDIDERLVGCGVLPPAVLQALTLWKGGMITNGELLELVKKDLEFEKNAKEVFGQNTEKLNEDSAFWGRFAFGERWAEKRSRLAALSPDSNRPGWDLNGIIVKSNDDLRQESFIMQLIELCQEAFQEADLELWMLPYRIISTGRTTGIIEMVRNAMSFDALKKRPGYGSGGLREHLHRMTQYAANPSEAFQSAQRNFVRSLAAYSLLSYLFLFKDRHNGNLLLDTAGHVIHIDFGFVFGVAPGGSFSLEMSTPFKLTEEMIEVMDGLRSSLFSEFVTLFCCGFLALQAHCDTFMTLVEVTARGSTFKCFEGRDTAEIVGKLRERFRPELGKEDSIAHVLDIIKEAIGSYGTKQYDYFQYISQGIAM
ncbi:phosphatidylinositol 3- and 4-kinase [Nitzschia inconspicua]|uniref:1-phosphatidylinositol 4-kinase n=1 Tax=Nitzschia inconspicua TaxID=303405 RepID=A0A9K3PL45_9STRA|nr:phosphatidylinositol 3- and 4-kinase [Nitzschia inconspicua]